MQTTLFVSDLHLPSHPSPLRDVFLRFLQGPARQAGRIYILGDLFEYWIGDDVGLQHYAAEVAGLAALSASGVRIHYQHGNRDFMVGRDFFAITGIAPLPDPTTIELGPQRVLISHGDRYCTDDGGYQRWRRFSRLRWAQWLFLRLPATRRDRISGNIRGNSDNAKRLKAQTIMDVNAQAVRRALVQHGVQRIIHGHTHRPGSYPVALPDRVGERVVLPDWRPHTQAFLRAQGEHLQTVELAPAGDTPTG